MFSARGAPSGTAPCAIGSTVIAISDASRSTSWIR